MSGCRFNLSRVAALGCFFVLAVVFLIFITGQSSTKVTGPPVPVFELPSSLSLCDEPVPLGRQAVWEMLDREFIVSVYDHAQVIMWMKRAHRYFPYLEKKLKERNMPDDLKYVAVVESALKTYAFSGAGAVGPWQFMEKTAKRYGLKVNEWIDERLNFERATEAALNYLGELYPMFGSWPLAMAAYNCGEDRINREISEQNINSFYDLNLPLETERYIFRILAAKIIRSAPALYNYQLPSESLYSPAECERIEFDAPEQVRLRLIASACATTFKAIKEMNPEIRNYVIPPGHYVLNVPKGTAAQFKANFARVLSQEKVCSKGKKTRAEDK